jgi:adenosylcobinamide kinase/adenosylcobinamide-phosphate guanylyltransferase
MIALVCGGVASGKSEIAENLTVSVNKGKLAYIATMAAAHDDECQKRIAKHRRLRQGKGFTTLEIPYSLANCLEQLAGYDTVLLECLSNLIANEMYLGRKSPEATVASISAGLKELRGKVRNAIIVSSTVLAGYKGYDEFTDQYIQVIGKLNCEIATAADVVIEAVCAIPVIHKGKPKLEIYGYENAL